MNRTEVDAPLAVVDFDKPNPLGHLERYAHALAGGTLALSGLAVALLRL